MQSRLKNLHVEGHGLPQSPNLWPDAHGPMQDWVPSCRRAVLVGCNYTAHHTQQLRGCANDVLCLADLLLSTFRQGWPSSPALGNPAPGPQATMQMSPACGGEACSHRYHQQMSASEALRCVS